MMRNNRPDQRPKRRSVPDMLPFDWRWVVLMLLGLVFARRYSPLLMIVLLSVGAYLAISAGVAAWRGGAWSAAQPRETYWRGQRIELPSSPARRSGMLVQRALAALAIVAGLGLASLALSMVVRIVS
jgi:hypothetical protein